MAFTAADQKRYLDAQPGLRKFCMSLTRNANDGEELCQEVMARAWERSDQFQPGSNMGAWLGTIAFNMFRSQKRRSHRMSYVGDANDVQMMGNYFNMTAQGSQLASLELEDIRAEIARLPAEQRDALFHLARGESYEATAIKCGAAVGTVKSRAHRARKHLSDHMNAEPVSPPAASEQQPLPVPALPRKEVLERLSTDEQSLLRAVRACLNQDCLDQVQRTQLVRLARFLGYQPFKKLSPLGYLDVNAASARLGLPQTDMQMIYEAFVHQLKTRRKVTLRTRRPVDFRLGFNEEAERVQGYLRVTELPYMQKIFPAFPRI